MAAARIALLLLLLALASSLAAGAPVCGPGCRAAQRDALENFYRGMNGSNWVERRGWLVEKDHCDWFGVMCCTGNGSVLSSSYQLDDVAPSSASLALARRHCGALAAACVAARPAVETKKHKTHAHARHPQTPCAPTKHKNTGVNLTCPADGAVVGLQLISNNLAGDVTPAFARAALAPLAPYLQYLYLRDNEIAGPIERVLNAGGGMPNLVRFGFTG